MIKRVNLLIGICVGISILINSNLISVNTASAFVMNNNLIPSNTFIDDEIGLESLFRNKYAMDRINTETPFGNNHAVDSFKRSSDIINDNDGEFNIAFVSDWGCTDDTEKTAENIQSKNPELVLSAGDASYEESPDCWFEIIEPFKSKMKIAMGDHEYSDTSDGVDEYLKPLNLLKTYYSFDLKNVHILVMDAYIDYDPGSTQYQFIEQDLKNSFANPKIDWTFVVESVPIYTSTTHHEGDSDIRDIYHPLFDRYGVDLVLNSDNHNYQRTFPLKYNSEDDNPTIADSNPYNYYNDEGVIYLIAGTGGRSLYDIEDQAPFVANQQDQQYGFLNIDIDSDKSLRGTFYANPIDSSSEDEDPRLHLVSTNNKNIIDQYLVNTNNKNIIDHFIISNIPPISAQTDLSSSSSSAEVGASVLDALTKMAPKPAEKPKIDAKIIADLFTKDKENTLQ